jgi:hypothetical protein
MRMDGEEPRQKSIVKPVAELLAKYGFFGCQPLKYIDEEMLGSVVIDLQFLAFLWRRLR